MFESARYHLSVVLMYFTGLGDGGTHVTTDATMTLPWFCDFGYQLSNPDDCDMKQDDKDNFEWTFLVGGTPSEGTGPPESGFIDHGTYKFSE